MKIIQAGVDREAEREQLSMAQLKGLGYRYIRIENPVYDEEPPLEEVFEGRKDWYVGKEKEWGTWGLIPRHYGCWLAHKQAIQVGFCEEEHFLVCEGDCRILDVELFKERLQEAIGVLNTSPHPLVTFSEPNVATSTTFFKQVSNHLWEFDNIINAHCYLVNKNSKHIFDWMFNNVGWHAFDWWLNFTVSKTDEKMLCFKEKLTSQFEGFSEIDKVYKR